MCCANWTSIEALSDALASLAGTGVDGGWFVVDPGSVAGRSGEDVTRLLDALERLMDGYDVVLAGNPQEVSAMAAGINGPVDDVDAALELLRKRAGLAGVVAHGESRAVAATPDRLVVDENFDVDATRHTGGGDRFDEGLAHALAREWEWADALHLGNACASRYVATGDSGTRDQISAFLRDRT